MLESYMHCFFASSGWLYGGWLDADCAPQKGAIGLGLYTAINLIPGTHAITITKETVWQRSSSNIYGSVGHKTYPMHTVRMKLYALV